MKTVKQMLGLMVQDWGAEVDDQEQRTRAKSTSTFSADLLVGKRVTLTRKVLECLGVSAGVEDGD